MKYTEIKGDCMVFVINRTNSDYSKKTNIINLPFFIENDDSKYFNFATIIHLGRNSSYGHYITVFCYNRNYYVYDDSAGLKIIDNVIDDNIYKNYMRHNSVMVFYYKLSS